MRKNRIMVAKRGNVRIPLWLRRKYKIEDGKAFLVVEKKQGLLLKPINSIWDMIGSDDSETAEKVNMLLDKLRHEDDEDDLQPAAQS